MERRAYTIGHSTRSLGDFLDLLKENAVAQLADVRRFPGSRRYPHFNQEALRTSLQVQGIAYRHFPELGGYRKGGADSSHSGWTSRGFRAYAVHMESREFLEELARLETWAKGRSTALMCAEGHPSRCHRKLISDALLRDGLGVYHILGPKRVEAHVMTSFARVAGKRLIYNGSGDTLWDQERSSD
jgi:uncharacterized protein (DUF488 family)